MILLVNEINGFGRCCRLTHRETAVISHQPEGLQPQRIATKVIMPQYLGKKNYLNKNQFLNIL